MSNFFKELCITKWSVCTKGFHSYTAIDLNLSCDSVHHPSSIQSSQIMRQPALRKDGQLQGEAAAPPLPVLSRGNRLHLLQHKLSAIQGPVGCSPPPIFFPDLGLHEIHCTPLSFNRNGRRTNLSKFCHFALKSLVSRSPFRFHKTENQNSSPTSDTQVPVSLGQVTVSQPRSRQK